MKTQYPSATKSLMSRALHETDNIDSKLYSYAYECECLVTSAQKETLTRFIQELQKLEAIDYCPGKKTGCIHTSDDMSCTACMIDKVCKSPTFEGLVG